MYTIINKKKQGFPLSSEDINRFSRGYISGEIPDYQASALLMAICLMGMNEQETADLTRAITESGDTVDLSAFGDKTVDKHSTGGVGDKTTLVLAPLLASLGARVAKMSGRGLGHTGGTVDKLESFDGYDTSLSCDRFISQVERVGVAVTGQTGNLAPLDKKLYALRDVTATVDSIPLIASSIMGKKLASGARSIVLDVKCGSGAFAKTKKEALLLAKAMVDIGKRCERRMAAVITDMDIPLGYAVGNSLEVKEAIEVLSGRGPADLYEVCVTLGTVMAQLSLGLDEAEAKRRVTEALVGGAAKEKFKEWLAAQGADISPVDDPSLFPAPKCSSELKASRDGYITKMNAEEIGRAAVALGAGRMTKDAPIDHSAGILLLKKLPDKVKAGESYAIIFAADEERIAKGKEILEGAITVGDSPVKRKPVIYSKIF